MDVTLERVIAGTSLFADLDPSEQAQVAELMRPFELGSGEVLFREGEIADRLYLIARGRVALQIRVDEELVLVRGAGAGDSLGEMALNGSWPRSGTATALEPVVGWYLETGDFDVIRRVAGVLAAKVLRRLALELCARVREGTAALVDRATGPAGDQTSTSGPRPSPPAPRAPSG
jgi:CRP-like cAMP-binding protein